MTEHEKFRTECRHEVERQGNDHALRELTTAWIAKAAEYRYSYHFEWLGRPIIQHPQDMVGVQQLLWRVKPDLIVETGIARGGSLVFYASILELIAQCGGDPSARVLGIDVDIRKHNREEIVAHPMSKRISMLDGSSVSPGILAQVRQAAAGKRRVLVCLDSNHTHDHVLEELRLYAPFVSRGSYCVVFDTIIEDMPADAYPDRPWGKSNNPKTAVYEYLELLKNRGTQAEDGGELRLEIDKHIESQLLITVAPDGFLLRV